MYENQHHSQGNTTDPFDEFVARLLNDTPDVFLPELTTISTPISTSTSTSTTPYAESAYTPAPSHTPSVTATTTYCSIGVSPHLTCKWLFTLDHPLVCNTHLPTDPKDVCVHFRHVHHIHGNEKVMVQCQWRDCHISPMQRGSLIRHVLTVHLGLLRWRCEMCGRTFSRKGTAHACAEDE